MQGNILLFLYKSWSETVKQSALKIHYGRYLMKPAKCFIQCKTSTSKPFSRTLRQ